MEVRDLLKSDSSTVISVPTDMTVGEAARVMADKKIGFTTVVDDMGKLAGVLSERDVLMCLTVGTEDAANGPVSGIMTKNAITCHLGDNVLQAVELMGSNRIRHLVVTENGAVAGVLSSRDLFDVMATRIEERGLISGEPEEDEIGETALRA